MPRKPKTKNFSRAQESKLADAMIAAKKKLKKQKGKMVVMFPKKEERQILSAIEEHFKNIDL